jgi:hypothetical protein
VKPTAPLPPEELIEEISQPLARVIHRQPVVPAPQITIPPPPPLQPRSHPGHSTGQRVRHFMLWAGLGLIVLVGALVWSQRSAHTAFQNSCRMALQTHTTPLKHLRHQIKILAREHSIEVLDKDLQITADPPNHQITVSVRYIRPLMGIPMRYRVEQTLSNYALPLELVADIPPTEIEVINISQSELEQYRKEKQRRAAISAKNQPSDTP